MTATDDAATRVLLAILNGHCHTQAIHEATHIARPKIHARLHQLRDAGLIDWADGCGGTVHALVAPVAMPPRPQKVGQ